MRARAEKKFIESMKSMAGRPVEDCLAVARDGSPCIESKTPVDIEESLGMYHGNIFHDAPTFPYAEGDDQAGASGVETEFENVFSAAPAPSAAAPSAASPVTTPP
ncbi:MAG: hypothetical protein QOI07_694 [Verrucomicrobiota bacterium]|jgi:hypothetical protein